MVGGALVGGAGAVNSNLGLAILLAGILLSLLTGRPVFLALLAVLGLFFVQRVGSTSTTSVGTGGISYSDALLALATAAAVPALVRGREFGRLWPALGFIGIYLVCLLPSVLAHPETRTGQEWLHRLILTAGAMVVGAWLVREGLTRVGLRVFCGVATAVAFLAMVDWSRHGFHPASPLTLNKNFVGSQLGVALVLMLLAGDALHLRRHLRVPAVVLVAAGLLATQSRGAQLGAVLALLLGYVLMGRAHGRKGTVLAVLVSCALAGFTYASISSQQQTTESDRNTNSIGVRRNVEKVTREIWRTSPVVGVGMKYFNTGDYGYFAQAPNNVVDNELAESGLVGLLGFAASQVGLFAVGFRRRAENPLVVAGVAVVAGQLMHGMVDVYWTAGTASVPYLVLGMGLAAVSRSDRSQSRLQGGRRRRGRADGPGHRRSMAPVEARPGCARPPSNHRGSSAPRDVPVA